MIFLQELVLTQYLNWDMIIQRQKYTIFLILKNKCQTNPLINQVFKKKDVFLSYHDCPVKVDRSFFELIEIQSINWHFEIKQTWFHNFAVKFKWLLFSKILLSAKNF